MVYCAQGEVGSKSYLVCVSLRTYMLHVCLCLCVRRKLPSIFLDFRKLTSCCYLSCEDVTPELAKLGIHAEGVGTVNSNSYHGNQYQAQTIS